MRVKRVIFICIFMGALSSAAQAVLPLGGNVARNVSDIGEAVGANPRLVQQAVLNPSCSNPQFNKYDVGVFGYRKPLTPDLPLDARRLFNRVGFIEVDEPSLVDGNIKAEKYLATATLALCKCVVVTAAHSFFDSKGDPISDIKQKTIIILPGGKPEGYKIKDYKVGGSVKTDADIANDWAVVTLDGADCNGPSGYSPLLLPPENLSDKDLNGEPLFSVALNHGAEGPDIRRISECPRKRVNSESTIGKVSGKEFGAAKDPGPVETLRYNYCSFSGSGSGSMVVPLSGPYKFNLIEMNVATRVPSGSTYSKDDTLPADATHYNVAIPVRGGFRDAIINACQDASTAGKSADASK